MEACSRLVLTVFIATHNGAALLPRVLESYTQLRPPAGGWKLVLIDNASDDDSAQIARSFASRLPLICVSEPIRGKNRALNTGLCALEGDLAVFGDDDGIPDPDWLVQLRKAADSRGDYAIFGGRIEPIWTVEPADWILHWVRLAPVFSVTDPVLKDGPCHPARIWGPNMAIRAVAFRNGHRFDERVGPDGSGTYAMGGETEFTLRLTIAEGFRSWHCRAARVRHIITPGAMATGWILKRAFRLGRCLYRESAQNAAAGRHYHRRDSVTIRTRLANEVARLASARSRVDARGMFEARWQLNLFIGCLFEAGCSTYVPLSQNTDVPTEA